MTGPQIDIPTQAGMPREADAVVIGGGVVGVATAFWLSRAGLDTVVVERGDGLSTLTTARSAECVRAQFTEPAMAALARPSLEFFEDFEAWTGQPQDSLGLHQQGYLFATANPAMVAELEQTVGAYHRLGLTDAVLLSGDEVRARFGYVSPDVQAATFRQRDGWLSSHALTYGLARASHGRFLLRTSVLGIRLAGGRVCGVDTDRGPIATPVVVNAAGPFAAPVARMVGVELPIQTVRRQKFVVAAGARIPAQAAMTIDIDNGSYWRPEAGGALCGWVDPDEPPSDPAEDLPVDWYFPALVIEKLARLTPLWADVGEGLRQSDVFVSAGQYSYTPDDQPLLGPVPEVPGFHLNCGYWAGVMLSPEAGRWVCDLITGARPTEQNPLRLSRFREGPVAAGSSLLRGHH